MTDKVKTLQQQNDQLIECKQTYEEMLQANRYTLKQLSIENRDKQTQIDKYKQTSVRWHKLDDKVYRIQIILRYPGLTQETSGVLSSITL